MPLQNKLNKFSTASPIIPSFNFQDIESGTGIVSYYGVQYATSEGIAYTLRDRNSEGTPGTIEGSKTLDLTPFNMPKTISGVAWVNAVYLAGSGVSNFKVEIFHVLGETETDISGGGVTNEALNSGVDVNISFPVPLDTTFFTEDSILRIKVSGGTNHAKLDKPMEFQIPSKLDL